MRITVQWGRFRHPGLVWVPGLMGSLTFGPLAVVWLRR